jgi:hypothetical protein
MSTKTKTKRKPSRKKDDGGDRTPLGSIASRPKSWREVVKVHPGANLFPLMSPEELRELGEDIKKNGLATPIAYGPRVTR